MGILQPNGYYFDNDEQKDAKIAHGKWMVETSAPNGRRDQLRVSEYYGSDICKSRQQSKLF